MGQRLANNFKTINNGSKNESYSNNKLDKKIGKKILDFIDRMPYRERRKFFETIKICTKLIIVIEYC